MNIAAINTRLLQHANRVKYAYVHFGIFGIIAYPFYYFLWVYAAPQGYENIFIRVIATLLCVPLAFKNYWPNRLKKFFTALLVHGVTLLFALFLYVYDTRK